MKFLFTLVLTCMMLAASARAEREELSRASAVRADSTKQKRGLDELLRETRSALDSAMSYFRSPEFDSLKSELRTLARDSKLLARELKHSADSVSKLVLPYLDSIKPYIDSLTSLGEAIESNHGFKYSFRGFPEGYRLEGSFNESEHWQFDEGWEKQQPRKREKSPLPRGYRKPFEPNELPENGQMPVPPRSPRAIPMPVPPHLRPSPESGRSIPNYPGWKIQPLEQEENAGD